MAEPRLKGHSEQAGHFLSPPAGHAIHISGRVDPRQAAEAGERRDESHFRRVRGATGEQASKPFQLHKRPPPPPSPPQAGGGGSRAIGPRGCVFSFLRGISVRTADGRKVYERRGLAGEMALAGFSGAMGGGVASKHGNRS